MTPLVPHLIHQGIRSWPLHDEGGTATYMTLTETLRRRFPTDAHFSAYSVPGIARRLSSDALGHPDIADGIPMVAAVFDVDCDASHAALGGSSEIPAPDLWWLDEIAKIQALFLEHPGGVAYRTRGGYRLVYSLPEPFVIRGDREVWAHQYVLWVAYLRRRFRIVADPACADWTRLFRCPHATRVPEQGPEEREVMGDASAVGVWACATVAADDELAKTLRRARKSKIRVQKATSGPSPIVGGRGVLFHALHARGVVGPELNQGKWAIECAWAAEHSKGSRFDSSTVLFAPREGEELGWPHCAHAHCQRRTLRDWMALFTPEEIVTARVAAGLSARPVASGRAVCGHIVVDHHEDQVNEAAAAALAQLDNVYQRAGMVVEVIVDPCPIAGGPRIREIPLAKLRELLVAAAEWTVVKERKGGPEEVPTHPPDWAVRAVHARGEWPGMRTLVGVVECPVLRPDGSVLQDAGFDEATGLLYLPNATFPRVPERPSQEDAREALAVLEAPFADFRFENAHHKAAVIATVLTPLARAAFDGPSPLKAISATTPGEGKTLLADTIVLICTGRPAPKMSHTPDDEETRKAITALGLEGAACAVIDNVAEPLGSPALDNALTSTTWKDRALGKNAMISVPLRIEWIATGNNLAYAGDTFRRVLPIHLNSQVENPEARSKFVHKNLRLHVRAVRPELVCAALTILRGYFGAGRPNAEEAESWGSFEGWSGLIPPAIVWAGGKDPVKSRSGLEAQTDQSKSGLTAILDAWQTVAPDGLTIAAAIRALYPPPTREPRPPEPPGYATARDTLESLVPLDRGHSPNARRLGKAFQKYRGRVSGTRKLDSQPCGGMMRWKVVTLSP